ncbi:MAG: hypothetical protein VX913_07935 [Planctomycetota bacterium]|nr:hypothetical protein [Planctomycetota bacterium]
MTHRESILRALVRYDRPPDEVLVELDECGPESDEAVGDEAEAGGEAGDEDEDEQPDIALTPDDAIAVLTRFVEGDLTTDELDRWCDVVRDHDGVVLDSDHRHLLEPLFDEIPELTTVAAEAWIARLDQDV